MVGLAKASADLVVDGRLAIDELAQTVAERATAGR
jgi:hypothetical protein